MAPNHPKPTKNRRRKKRRTEDFSSDSDSSDSDSGTHAPVEEPNVAEQNTTSQAININDIEIDSDSETTAISSAQQPSEVQQKIDSIKFTKTDNQTLAEASENVVRDRKELDSQFLAHMATTFGDELDELRQSPDFTENSIVLLAKTLQSGSNIFDSETLEALLSK